HRRCSRRPRRRRSTPEVPRIRHVDGDATRGTGLIPGRFGGEDLGAMRTADLHAFLLSSFCGAIAMTRAAGSVACARGRLAPPCSGHTPWANRRGAVAPFEDDLLPGAPMSLRPLFLAAALLSLPAVAASPKAKAGHDHSDGCAHPPVKAEQLPKAENQGWVL